MVVRRPTSGSIVRGPVEGDVLGPGGLPWDPGVGGGAAPWKPEQYTGYVLDFWAESGITEAGTGVSAWADATGTLTVSQGTDANRPTYEAAGLGGKPSVRFVEANSDYLVNATGYANAATSYTFYLFCDPKVSTSAYRYVVDSLTGRLILEMTEANGGTVEVAYFDGAHKPAGAATTGAQALVWRLEDGVGGEVFRGTTSIGTATYTPKSLGGRFTVGAGDNGAANHSDISIGRLIVYAAAHDNATIAANVTAGKRYYGI